MLTLGLFGLVACSGSTSGVQDGGSPPGHDGGGLIADAGAGDARTFDGSTGHDGGHGEAPDGGPPVPLASLSDDFSGSTLDPSWSVLHGPSAMISLSQGSLQIHPTENILWFNDSEGLLVFKLVTGDFKATATVHARSYANPSVPPTNPIHLGGVMARAPTAPPENYVFVVVGHDVDDISVETKSTTDSSSMYSGPTWPSGDAQLRLCRVGDQFLLLKRAIGAGAWQQAAQFSRPDLPDTLQVGPNAYADAMTGAAADLLVTFDEFVFAEVSDLASCSSD